MTGYALHSPDASDPEGMRLAVRSIMDVMESRNWCIQT